MIYGYVRVSTHDQNKDMQIEALIKQGVPYTHIIQETASGAKADRPLYQALLRKVVKGDMIVVWRLDRFGRSLRELVMVKDHLKEKGVGLRSVMEGIDTTTSTGNLMINMLSVVAEFERELIKERVNAGIASARKRGRVGGRPFGLSPENIKKAQLAQQLDKDLTLSIPHILYTLQISKTSFYKYIKLDLTEFIKEPARQLRKA